MKHGGPWKTVKTTQKKAHVTSNIGVERRHRKPSSGKNRGSAFEDSCSWCMLETPFLQHTLELMLRASAMFKTYRLQAWVHPTQDLISTCAGTELQI
jgi:hypothetical protein